MEIKVIELHEVLKLRQEILWPDRPASFSAIAGDESAQHFGVWADGGWRAVLSIFETTDGFQIRKLGTQENYRRKGYGSALLDRALTWCFEQRKSVVFLDARLPQVIWYEKCGWIQKGKPFQKYEKAYQRMIFEP